MKCSRCHKIDTKVIESRDVADGEAIRRRRACLNCEYRFTTYERLERPQLNVVKNDGTRELFNRDKLLAGLLRASEKTKITSLQLEELVATVEQKIYACGEQEVTSAKVGDLVMDELAKLDEVAYVRFASVYRRFKDIAGFEKELLQIRKRKAEPVKNV
ncbi:MAG: transcriptional regulator NrdR [Candidatus Saccharibacteria bacterium]|nr:transcriptional regulator NrdR [Candidatus Saccharibacteria bacterium]